MTYRVGREGQKFEKYFAFSHDCVKMGTVGPFLCLVPCALYLFFWVLADPKKTPLIQRGLKKVVVDG